MAETGQENQPLRALAERTLFKVWSRDILRLSDIDHQKHVNNAVHPGLFTNGRFALIHGRLGHLTDPGDAFALVKITIEYLSEMHYPGEVEVGTLVRRIGNSSVIKSADAFLTEMVTIKELAISKSSYPRFFDSAHAPSSYP